MKLNHEKQCVLAGRKFVSYRIYIGQSKIVTTSSKDNCKPTHTMKNSKEERYLNSLDQTALGQNRKRSVWIAHQLCKNVEIGRGEKTYRGKVHLRLIPQDKRWCCCKMKYSVWLSRCVYVWWFSCSVHGLCLVAFLDIWGV